MKVWSSQSNNPFLQENPCQIIYLSGKKQMSHRTACRTDTGIVWQGGDQL